MISIDAKKGIETGISAYDRAYTIRLAASSTSTIQDCSSPGHIFPLQARKGGVSVRQGHTEASVELASLAGKGESAVICEIIDDDGSMMRLPRLIDFAKVHGIKIASIENLRSFILESDREVA